MKRVELLTLELTNFMGVRSFRLELDGANATVRATNGAGKTTLATAFSWLLTGKDSRGQADFQIKTLQPTGEPLHNLEHTVEATLRVDGEEVTLRRAFKEIWAQKRGSVRDEFTGHETLFWLDGVPCGTKREFDDRVAELVPAAAWRELTNPDAWHAQHWQKRRSDLIDICGDVTNDDVIGAHPDLADLPGILGRRTVDEHRRVIDAKLKDINMELKLLPARIDEVRRGMPVAPDFTRRQLESAVATQRADRQKATELLAAARGGAVDVSAERKRLREVEDALTALDREALRLVSEAQDAAQGKVLAARRAIEDADHRHARLLEQTEELDADVARIDVQLVALRGEWKAVASQALEVHVEGVCPACQQDLPADQVEAAHRQATEELNAKKAKRLALLKERGEELSKRRDAKAAEVALNRSKAEGMERGRAALVAALEAAEKATSSTAKPMKDPTQGPEYAKLAAERDELTARIEQLTVGDETEIARLTAEAERLDGLIESSEKDLAAIDQRTAGEKRISELQAQEKALAAEYEDQVRQVDLLERFVRAKSRMLTDRINSHFAITEFRLFEEQINGGLQDACTALVDGVPYGAGLNRAARINSGLDVINALQKHHGVAVPVMVDEGESVVTLLPLNTQVVRLVVDERHVDLHIELDTKKEQVAA